MKKFIAISFILLSTNAVYANSGANFLPTAMYFPTLTGILFPNVTAAGGVNAASLPLNSKGTSAQGSYSRAGDSSAYFGGLSAVSKKFGINVGYLGSSPASSSTVYHNTFAGAGFVVDPIAIGIGVRSFLLSSTEAFHRVDLGVVAGNGKGATFGFVVYDVNSHAQLDVGVGFGGGKKYNMEVNLLLPQISGGSGSAALTLAGTINATDFFGLHFKTTLYMDSSSYQHVLGVVVWPWQKVGVFGQYATPNTLSAGINLSF